MADDEKLQLPSFGLGRRKKRREATPAPADEAPTEVQPVTEPDPAPEPEPEREPAPAPEPERESEPVPAAAPEPKPERPTEQLTAVHEPDPAPRPLFADEVAAAPVPTPEPRAAHDPEPEPEPDPEPARRRERTGPVMNPVAACLLVGLVVGGLVVALTWGALRGCEAIQGTSSCGNPGFFLLLAIMVLMVVLGSAMLRALGVSDPGSTAFLGLGLLAVIALLFLVDVLFAWWMVIAIPVASMLTFGVSRWVTTAFVDSSD